MIEKQKILNQVASKFRSDLTLATSLTLLCAVNAKYSQSKDFISVFKTLLSITNSGKDLESDRFSYDMLDHINASLLSTSNMKRVISKIKSKAQKNIDHQLKIERDDDYNIIDDEKGGHRRKPRNIPDEQ